MSWTEVFIGDIYTDYIQTTRFSTGEACDAAANPVVKIYERDTALPIPLSPVVLPFDPVNTNGFYRFTFNVAEEYGFEVDKCYCIRAEATVDGVAGGAIISKVMVRRNYWKSTPQEPVDRATTVEEAVGHIYSRLHNKQTKDHTTGQVTIYKVDGVTPMLTGTDTETDTTSTAGQLE
jgi:hypothetical protein